MNIFNILVGCVAVFGGLTIACVLFWLFILWIMCVLKFLGLDID